MTKKRPIAPIKMRDLSPGTPPTARPDLIWMAPTELLVDESYQRQIGIKGAKLIRLIIENFDWRKFKPPTVVLTDQGAEVIDGQHTAIAAATHPEIDEIPVVVIEADNVSSRASTFMGINRDRLNVTPVQLHAAAVVSGDATALRIKKICELQGVQILDGGRAKEAYSAGDTLAIRAIEEIFRKRGEEGTTAVLNVLGRSELAPVSSGAIKAVDFLLHDSDDKDTIDSEDIVRAIVALGGSQSKSAARMFAAEHKIPAWRALAAVWFRNIRKSSRASRTDSGVAAEV